MIEAAQMIAAAIFVAGVMIAYGLCRVAHEIRSASYGTRLKVEMTDLEKAFLIAKGSS